MTSAKTCGDGHFTCSVPGQGVPIASADEICDNECDDAQCDCTVVGKELGLMVLIGLAPIETIVEA